jgi:signal transduction histidine kinase
MLDRLSIRARLTAAFAAAMLLILALAGAFIYAEVDSHLEETMDENLEARAQDLAAAPRQALIGDEEITDRVLGSRQDIVREFAPILGVEAARRAASEPVTLTRRLDSGEFRLYARPVPGDGAVLIGLSTEDNSEALTNLLWAFLLGAPAAILLASGAGYLLAGRAMAPVSAMRRRASEITLERSGERLPLPPADDEIRRLGETLNTMLDRIEASLEQERAFVADAGHELRTPLAILRAELELAEREGRSPEELRAAIHSAAEETDRLSQLAEDLLIIARSDQGRLPIKREPVELRELLERVRGRFSARAAQQGREISIDAPAGVSAELDPLRIEQALGNLVDNALRHGKGRVGLTATVGDGRVRLDVDDQGSGFPEGFVERAFERFSRADEGRTGGGAGLGLAIVRAIARAHGGEARADGARVELDLPA